MAEELAAANAAWKLWTEENPGLCNTDYLSFLAGWAASAEAEQASERDLRERLAAEIEAFGKQPGHDWTPEHDFAFFYAAKIVRGATADTDPAGDNTTDRT